VSLRGPVALFMLLSGCSGCGEDGPHVPFKLQGKGEGGAAATGPVPDQEPREGSSYPESTESIELQGHKLSVKTHAFRAALEADLNQDGRRDALFVLQDERGVPRLATAIADTEGLGTIEMKSALLGEGESCAVESAALSRLSAAFALIRMRVACGDPAQLPSQPSAPEAPPAPPEPGEPIPPPAAEAPPALTPEPLDVLIRVESEPSVVETLAIDETQASDAADPAEATHVSASWSAADVDADEHVDLTLKLITQAGGQEPIELAINLLDRPGGLALDASGLEKTWLILADESKQARKGQPDKAFVLAQRVLTSHAALCREAGHALIEVGGERGVPCGASLAAGRSGTIEGAVLARRGQLLGALARSEDLLRTTVYALTENDRERIRYAITERTKAAAWKPGPMVVLGAAPSVRRSAIAYLDESRLLSRGAQGPLAHDLASGAQEPAAATALADSIIRDPAGKRVLTALSTRCDGVHVSIVNATQVVAGVASGAPVAEPILWPSTLPAEACASGGAVFEDAPELQVLGWTRSGIVLAVMGVLYAVPIDDANVTSAPLPLSAVSADVLTELGASSVSAGGKMVLVPTSAGLARVSPEGTMLIAWPAGITRGAVSDVALSPSGQRVAVLSASRVHFADLNEAVAPPPAPETGAPPAPPEPTHAPTP